MFGRSCPAVSKRKLGKRTIPIKMNEEILKLRYKD